MKRVKIISATALALLLLVLVLAMVHQTSGTAPTFVAGTTASFGSLTIAYRDPVEWSDGEIEIIIAPIPIGEKREAGGIIRKSKLPEGLGDRVDTEERVSFASAGVEQHQIAGGVPHQDVVVIPPTERVASGFDLGEPVFLKVAHEAVQAIVGSDKSKTKSRRG